MKTYFPGLNTLRFYAALSVVIHHFTIPNTWFGDQTADAYYVRVGFLEGGNAVTLFFVLSGFLILYLLIKEQESGGGVRVRRFYMRRIFRILPLYYFTVFAGALLVMLTWDRLPPNTQDGAGPVVWIAAMLYCLNLLGLLIVPISHLWSLNVEEQFYLFAPWLIRRAKSVPRALIGFILLKLGVQLGLLIVWRLTDRPLANYAYHIGLNMRFECMALGGLGAWWVLHDHAILRRITHPITQAITLVGCAVVVFLGGNNDLPFNTLSALIFALLILNITSAPRFVLRIESPLLRRLGDLSYAIYMVHHLVIWALWIAGVRGIAYPLLIIAITIALAQVIHTGVELPFLRLRDRLTRMPMPPNTLQS